MLHPAQDPTGAGRVLVLAPSGRDAETLRAALAERGLDAHQVPDGDAFRRAFGEGCGAALIAEEAIDGAVREAVAAQPAWSEVPFVVLTFGGDAEARVGWTAALRNATVLERPVRMDTILTAIESALRDRRRQYEVRDAIEALRDANARADAAIAAGDMGTWIYDIVEDRVYADRNLAAMFGVSPEVADGGPLAPYMGAMHPHDRRRVSGAIERAIAEGGTYETDYRLVGSDGTIRWVNARGRVERDAEGRAHRLPGAVVDITRRKATEEALAAARARETAILSSIGDGFYALDHKWRLTLFNHVCERYFGLARSEVLGRSYFEVFPQAVGSEIQERFERAVESEAADDFELVSPITGKKISMRIYPSLEGLTVLFADITERDAIRDALAESQRQLSFAQLAGRVGSFSWDIPADRVIWSPEIEALYGVPRGSFEGSFDDWRRRVEPQDAARVELDLAAALAAGRTDFDYEFRAILPDGERRWFEGQSRFEYEEDGAPRLMRGVNVDIDARKRAEEALREINEGLERQVQARTADLVSKIGELEGFCYSVSHDMRTPLRAIVSNARMVLEEEGDAVSESGKERLERLSAAALKMAHLIDDLLQYARLGAAEPRRESCDLTALARRVADEALLDRPGTDAIIDVAPGLVGPCDPRLMGLVFHNLVDNALKYQPSGRAARVEIAQDAGGAFFVRDNGIGFEPQYAERIFRPFERLHRDGDYAGTGIGLANAQRIVERHGGRLWAEGVPNEGATFRFTLQ